MEPKYLTKKQFETYVSVIEALIDTDEYALIPKEAAIRMDNLLSKIDNPVLDQLGLIFFYVRYLLPTYVLRLPPFHRMSLEFRRKAIEKFITKRGIFRDIARAMKVLSCVPYYSSEEGKKQVGFIEYEQRSHFELDFTKPIKHEEI